MQIAVLHPDLAIWQTNTLFNAALYELRLVADERAMCPTAMVSRQPAAQMASRSKPESGCLAVHAKSTPLCKI